MDKISELRELLLKLQPERADGFEGLLANVLTEITGTVFSIAKSGPQGGKDGQSALNDGAVSFEAKLYNGKVPADEVITKIAQVSVNRTASTELFIIGSTGPIPSQTGQTIEDVGKDRRIATLLLDWPTAGLPSLAALLAMAKDVSAKFLAEKTGCALADVVSCLDAVRAHSQFPDRESELQKKLDEPNLAPAYARQFNDRWLTGVLGNSRQARIRLGQPLAPGDAAMPSVHDRQSLRQQLSKLIFAAPNTKITVILGGDGNGKSWLFGQAWLKEAFRPLTIILTPDHLKQQAYSKSEIIDLLISKLIEQTDDTDGELTKERWRQHFDRWEQSPNPDVPRLLVFLDGINQRERYPWAKFINSLNDVLAARGCKLCVSSRKPQFNNIKDQIIDLIETVTVPEWTEAEVAELLKEYGVAPSELTPKVARSLRNPRIFGLAARLVKDNKASFGELSVSRILFEHIRMGGGAGAIAPADFISGVQQHADEVIVRLKAETPDDLRIFDRRVGANNSTIEDRLGAIAAGHVFEDVPGEPSLYGLREESVPLSLGLSLVKTAKSAARNEQNIGLKLSEIIDPIAALDITAEVLLSSLIAAILEGDAPEPAVAALVTAYIGLQNLDQDRYEEFRSLMRKAPGAFLLALENSILSDGVTSNLDLLTETIEELRREDAVKAAVEQYARRWLRMYSLAPERMMHVGFGQPKEEVDRAREKSIARISEAMAALSPTETRLLEAMHREERGDYAKLATYAFCFMAGLPLASFAEEFRDFCFASSLNGGYRDGRDTFFDLLQFNRVDWRETRDAVLKVAETLKGSNISTIGRWTLVSLLRCTAESNDAKKADDIAEDLTKDRERFKGWRRIEDWCETDPCDPSSLYPANIDNTAIAYAAINITEIKTAMGQSINDWFFDDARTGLARFKPEVAIDGIRRFAVDALTRSKENFRFSMFFLENHTAALTNEGAKAFVAKAAEMAATSIAGDDKYREVLIGAEYALQVAFPHITGDEQLRALLAHPKHTYLALDLCRLMRAADGKMFEECLEAAFTAKDDITLFRLMAFAEYTDTPVSARSLEIIRELVSSKDSLVRLCALGVAYRLKNPELLKAVVDSGWTAAKLDSTKARFEIAVGSQAMIEALALEQLPLEDCVSRISIEWYARLVERIGDKAALEVSGRVTVLLRKAAGHEVAPNLPDIKLGEDNNGRPALFNVQEKPNPNQSIRDSFARATESNEAFQERQKRNNDALDKFERELTESGALLILYHLDSSLLQSIFESAPEIVRGWARSLVAMDQRAITRVHNIGLSLAQVIAASDQELSILLFGKLARTTSHVNIVFGRAELPLSAISVWEAADGENVNKMRFERLDHAGNDFELANEVLAAINSEKQHVIEAYVRDRRAREEPSHIARAIMVAGFSEEAPWSIETLDAHKSDAGFLGAAHKAARYAMDRHIWSKHWARMMRDAKTPDELWRYAVILQKIVDGRFSGSEMNGAPDDAPVWRYGQTFNGEIKQRIQKWKGKRDGKLFGMDKPDSCFIG